MFNTRSFINCHTASFVSGHRWALRLGLVAAFSLFLAGSAMAQTRTWVGLFGGGDGVSWNDPNNWSPSFVPTEMDDAVFNSGPPTINVPFGTAKELRINSGSIVELSGGGGYVVLSGDAKIDGGTLTLNGVSLDASILNLPRQDIRVGINLGSSFMNIQNGSVANSAQGFIGQNSGSTGTVTVTGASSQWEYSDGLYVGDSGTGTLNVLAGALVNDVYNNDAFIGRNSGSTGTATVTGVGSRWRNSGNLYLGTPDGQAIGGSGQLTVSSGGRVQVGNDFFDSGSASEMVIGSSVSGKGNLYVTEIGASVDNDGESYVGASSGFIGNVALSGRWHNSKGLFLGGTSSSDGGKGSLTVFQAGNLNVGNDIGDDQIGFYQGVSVSDSGSNGNLVVRNGSTIDSQFLGTIGFSQGSSGTATVMGENSRWDQADELYVGYWGTGTLNVADKGTVTNSWGFIGDSSSSIGTATVTGTNSLWQNSSTLTVGNSGTGTLNVVGGGKVTNSDGFVGMLSGSTGTVTVGNGVGASRWEMSGGLTVGGAGIGNLNVNSAGTVTVGATTSIGANGTVTMGGGRFDFGRTDLATYNRIGGNSGALAGGVTVTGVNQVSSLTFLNNANSIFDISEVAAANTGILYGSAFLDGAIRNQANGELRTFGNDWVRFAGTGNTNAGVIHNLGGTTEFANDLTNTGDINITGNLFAGLVTNQNNGEVNNTGGSIITNQFINEAGGFIGGRGQFTANGGWTNDGVMAFSAGFADVFGDVANAATGMIAIGGGSVATFYDDVTMDAGNMNINVSQNSDAVFFGSYNGGSTGLGTVHAFGDLRPGHSPASVSFGGDLELGAGTFTQIELAGLGFGEFDQLNVAGDLFLNGILDVQLIDGFSLGYNQWFQVGNVDGTLFGGFSNFANGDVVGTFGGIDLFIEYAGGGGGGNGFALFSIPEPSSSMLVLLGALVWGINRRSRKPILTA